MIKPNSVTANKPSARIPAPQADFCANKRSPNPFALRASLRSEEADRGASGSDGAEPLGGDPAGGLQARTGTRGDQALAES